MQTWSDASNETDTIESATGANLQARDVTLLNKVMRPVRVVLSGTTIADEERRVIRAALRAIDENGFMPIELTEIKPGEVRQGDWLIWLSSDEPPASQIANVIFKSRDFQAAEMLPANGRLNTPLIVRARQCGNTIQGANGKDKTPGVSAVTAGGNCWIITQPLTPSTALSGQFTLQLATLLLNDANRQLNLTARQHDHRQLPETETFSTQLATATHRNSSEKKGSAGDVLAIVLVALLATERFIANRQQL